MQGKQTALIPECLVKWADQSNGHAYELWRTPEVKPGRHLYHYLHGVEIGKEPCDSDMEGRKLFERRVEEKAS